MIKEEFFIGNAPVVLYGGGAAENAATLPTDKEKNKTAFLSAFTVRAATKKKRNALQKSRRRAGTAF